MELDVRTILFFFLLINVSIALLLTIYTFSIKRFSWFLIIYIGGKLFIALALLLLGLRGNISDIVSISVGNSILIFGVGMELFALQCYDGMLRKNVFNGMISLAIAMCLAFFIWDTSQGYVRIILIAIPLAVFSLIVAISFIFYRSKSKFSKFIGILYLAYGIAHIFRALTAYINPNYTFIESSNWVEISFLITSAIVTFLGAMGFLLLLKEKQEMSILEANDQLNELNITKDKFFSIIAHDLRGPIGALNNMGQLLLDQHGQITDEDREELINAVNESSGIALDLLNNLLYWAQSESGQLKVNITKFRPTDLLSRAALIFREAANLKHIKINVPSRSSEIAYADMEMIDTVVRNLFSNAIKFTPENGEISAGFDMKEDGIQIWVKDSGVGMDKEVLAKLFRLDSDHSTKGTNMESGSGLGLKLCKEFVEKNHGDIWVTSEVGHGSKFCFTLHTTPNFNGHSKKTETELA